MRLYGSNGRTPPLYLGNKSAPAVRIDFTCSLQPTGAPGAHRQLTWYQGSVIGFGTGAREHQLGRVHAFVLDVAGAELPYGVLDRDGEAACYRPLFDTRTGQWRRSIVRQMSQSAARSPALFIHEVALAPAVRGRGLGLHVLERAIQHLGRGCGVAALKAFPLQFGGLGWGEDDDYGHALELHHFSTVRYEARRKLEAYYARVDFKSVTKSGFMLRALSPAKP